MDLGEMLQSFAGDGRDSVAVVGKSMESASYSPESAAWPEPPPAV